MFGSGKGHVEYKGLAAKGFGYSYLLQRPNSPVLHINSGGKSMTAMKP